MENGVFALHIDLDEGKGAYLPTNTLYDAIAVWRSSSV